MTTLLGEVELNGVEEERSTLTGVVRALGGEVYAVDRPRLTTPEHR